LPAVAAKLALLPGKLAGGGRGEVPGMAVKLALLPHKAAGGWGGGKRRGGC